MLTLTKTYWDRGQDVWNRHNQGRKKDILRHSAFQLQLVTFPWQNNRGWMFVSGISAVFQTPVSFPKGPHWCPAFCFFCTSKKAHCVTGHIPNAAIKPGLDENKKKSTRAVVGLVLCCQCGGVIGWLECHLNARWHGQERTAVFVFLPRRMFVHRHTQCDLNDQTVSFSLKDTFTQKWTLSHHLIIPMPTERPVKFHTAFFWVSGWRFVSKHVKATEIKLKMASYWCTTSGGVLK